MKIHHEVQTRTLLPYTTIHNKVDFEGSEEEWQKVKKDLIIEISIG